MTILLALFLAVAQSGQPAAGAFNPRASELIESDPDIRSWAVRIYDRNRDGWLTLYEAQPAAESFREIADADRDGRVTVREYEAALAFIRARY